MKRIVILGAGESGAGAAVLAKVKGFETFVSDMSAIKDKYKELLDSHQIAWEEGHHTEELILNADEVIKSPGIPNDAPIILKLKAQGTPVISEIEFAGRYTDAKMICITGSNGKTTTTSLIYHIFKSAGLNVGLAGNIGKSLALQVAEDYHDYYIIELSSFQLDNMYNFRANIAVLMNITPDHLDRYDHCMQNYIDAKFRITQNQTPDDAFIFWNDDPIIRQELAKHGLKAHLYPFAAVKEDGAIAYVEDHEVKITEPIAFNMEQEELALTGQHNLYNSLAADPVEEIKVGFDILKSLRIRSRGINFIACPTCSRQEFDVIGTVNALEQRLEDIITPMDVSIIGCVVNGPGEALVSDLGVTGGNKKSGYYLDGERQKERFDNDAIIDQLEAKIRAKVAQQDPKNRII